MNPEDVPTINQILKDYGLNDILDPESYADLLAELQNRDNVLLSDAAENASKKTRDKIAKDYVKAMNKIIEEV